MKTILVPTDFSVYADNALQYAAGYAASLAEPVQLLLLHVLELPMMAAEVPLEIIAEDRDRMAELAKTDLYQREHDLKSQFPGIDCQTLARTGILGNLVHDLCRERHVDLVIMGTQGAKGLMATFAGSNTYMVASDAVCPVLAVPADARFSPFAKVLFAADLSRKNTRELQQVVEQAQPSGARVLVLHVEKTGNKGGAEPELWQRLEDATTYPAIDYITAFADSVEEGIGQTILQENPDLLVVCPREHSFFESLFRGSHTRKLVLSPTVPLPVLPTGAKH